MARATGASLARNSLLNIGGQFLPLLAAAVAIPIVAARLGTDRFGILSLVWAVLGYFAEFGFGRATTKYVAELHERGEYAQLQQTVWNTFWIQAVIGVGVGIVIAAATFPLAAGGIEIPPALRDEFRATFLLLALTVPLALIAGSFRGVLEGAQRFDYVNLVRVPSTLSLFLAPLIAVLLGWSLAGMMILLLLSRVGTLVAFVRLSDRVVPGVARIRWMRRGGLRALVSYGSWISVSGVISPIMVYLDRFLLGAFVGMTAVAYYTPPYEVVTRLWIVPTSLIAAMFPAFSALAAAGRHAEISRLLSRSLKYVLIMLGPIIVGVLAAGGDVLLLWLGPEYAAQGDLPLMILAVGVLISSIAYMPHGMIQGVGRADVTAKIQLLELPISIVLAVVLVQAWGVAGAALAWTLRVVLDATLLIVGARRLDLLRPGAFADVGFFRAAGVLLLAGAPLVFVCALWDSSIGSIGLALLWGVGVLPLLWTVALDPDERAFLIQSLRRSRSVMPAPVEVAGREGSA